MQARAVKMVMPLSEKLIQKMVEGKGVVEQINNLVV